MSLCERPHRKLISKMLILLKRKENIDTKGDICSVPKLGESEMVTDVEPSA